MNEPKTPNLGLNKIDRSSPSTTYFDLDKYLDQNWEKVDEGVGQVEEKAEETAAQVSSIQERLDTEKRRSVTLEPGLQIINAERASAFKFEGLKVSTLINLLGRDGNGESLSGLPVATNAAIIALDTTTKDLGTSSFKVTSTGSVAAEHYVDHAVLNVKVGAYYVLVGMTKPNAKSNGRIMAYGIVDEVPSDFFPESNLANVTDKYAPVVLAFNPKTATKAMIRLRVPNANGVNTYIPDGQEVNYDSIRIYEITATEYAALDSMTPEQVATKYPYIDSVQPVRNPYAIRYGENLLPPFYEYVPAVSGTSTLYIRTPYEADLLTTATTQPWNTFIPIVAGETYTLSYESSDPATAYINLQWIDDYGSPLGYSPKNENGQTVQAPANAVRAKILVTATAAGTFIFRNPILNIGNTAKPFKPREDATLALQTDLYADPLTGANADEVFEKDGKYFKLSKWKRVVIDGNYIREVLSVYPGYKSLTSPANVVNALLFDGLGVLASTKYNGDILKPYKSNVTSDMAWIAADQSIRISIPNTDSGWGDAYTPTAEEIKAYFMGWTMFNGAAGTGVGNSPDVPTNNVYNGTGAKWWVRRSDGVARTWADATNTLPTTQASNWTPYQLLYQLATPTVEPITSEGQLTFIEGNNQVEVGTGIVLREKATPRINTVGDYYTINTSGGDTITALNNKVGRFIGVFRDSKMDTKWIDNTFMPYGRVRKVIPTANFDSSATYTVTYIMLDSFPISPFEGSYATNEKAMLIDMNDNIQQNKQAVSVVEQSLSYALKPLIQQNKRNVWGPIE
ncbi:hypothetical protein [Paenibacillus pabuli]|uniref:hypothetical protein n=1 Tax=Paenibacillus pabuli TaxID=1472 RepID=UPI003CE8674A